MEPIHLPAEQKDGLRPFLKKTFPFLLINKMNNPTAPTSEEKFRHLMLISGTVHVRVNKEAVIRRLSKKASCFCSLSHVTREALSVRLPAALRHKPATICPTWQLLPVFVCCYWFMVDKYWNQAITKLNLLVCIDRLRHVSAWWCAAEAFLERSWVKVTFVRDYYKSDTEEIIFCVTTKVFGLESGNADKEKKKTKGLCQQRFQTAQCRSKKFQIKTSLNSTGEQTGTWEE